ncbi:MAG: hypothetical protein NWR72_13870 [Bacteroidia bacterium]|nr:hypothetical protein [Bacteroidia bacterium]
MKSIISSALLLLSNIFLLHSQSSNLGLPFIFNYSKDAYGAATQNWELGQDETGVMYVANNDGLLTYDGRSWKTYPLPNRTIVRSLAIDKRGRIYVGGQDELGYFLPNDRGILTFHSIKEDLPAEFRQFEDVWDLLLVGEDIWFRTNKQICRISEGGVIGFLAQGGFGFMEAVNGVIWAFDWEKGLSKYEGESWTLIQGSEALKNMSVTGIVSRDESVWIGTVRNGLWTIKNAGIKKLDLPCNDFLISQRIHAIEPLKDGLIAIGTAQQGLLIVDSKGQVQQWLHKGNGLQNNHVLSLETDRAGNLWVGLNNGIDYVETSSPYRRILPDLNLEGAGFAMTNDKESWWLGTANGLYRLPFQPFYDPLKEQNFQLMSGAQGQVWGLTNLDNQVLVGHYEGAFQAENPLHEISRQTGFWDFIQVPGFPDICFGGTYLGLIVLKKSAGSWEPIGTIPGLQESSRLLVADQQKRIWMAHPYRGIFAIDLSRGIDSASVVRYGKSDGLPDDNFNNVFWIHGDILFGTVDGVYQFDAPSGRFAPAVEYQKAIGKQGWIKAMKEGEHGNIWFVMNNEVGQLNILDQGLEKEVTCRWLPELTDKLVKGHEFIYPFDENHVFFGVDNGFIRFDPSYPQEENSPASTILSGFWLQGEGDSLIFGGSFADSQSVLRQQPTDQIPIFNHQQNTFRFEVSATKYSSGKPMEYRFQLIGFEKDWLGWATKAEKEYTKLPPGNYSFRAQARDEYGRLTSPIFYSFTILPPWYASQPARILYGILFFALFLGLLLIPQWRFKEEREKLKSDMERQDKERKREITELRTQSLQAEIQHKNRELATSTMHLVQKNEILSTVRGELEKLNKEIKESEPRSRIKSLLRMVNQDEQLDQDWEQFAYHFDQVHSNFLKRLRDDFPGLTPKDHRICAYLRMNLSSKEIAPLMNISVRGVEISRYRLRKKLDLDHDANLNEFMMRY